MKRKNYINKLQEFISEWDSITAESGVLDANSMSCNGNINILGSVECYESEVLKVSDPRFFQAIEPGIRPLINYIACDLGYVTYTSCEGHRSIKHVPMRERYVGILPRTPKEFGHINDLLVKTKKNLQLYQSSIQLSVEKNFVESDDTTERCIDLYFRWKSNSEERYFKEIDTVSSIFLNELKFQSA